MSLLKSIGFGMLVGVCALCVVTALVWCVLLGFIVAQTHGFFAGALWAITLAATIGGVAAEITNG